MKKIALTFVAAFFAVPMAANALVADFTNAPGLLGGTQFPAATFNPGPPPSGTTSYVFAGPPAVTVTVTGIPQLGFPTDAGPGLTPFAGTNLVGETDGLGVFGDEVETGPQSIEIAFSTFVKISDLAFLDLFYNAGENNMNPPMSGGRERAQVDFFNGAASVGQMLVDAAVPRVGTGYLEVASTVSAMVTRLVFTAPSGNAFIDDTNNDYAVAAIKFSVVPLPAPALLLLGALGGFAFLRRRQTA